MLANETTAKLRQLKLNGLADAYEDQKRLPQYASLSFDERLGLMVFPHKTGGHVPVDGTMDQNLIFIP